MPLTLVIANKNYSSWSMRPWVLMKHFGIPFDETMLKFDSGEWDAHIGALSPTRMVPVLWDGPAGANEALSVWDTLAIAEYLAERHPDHAIWPRDARARARARSIAAEMHSGFRALRMAMPMNIRSHYPGKGATPECMRDIARIEGLWHETRASFGTGGPFLFGDFSAADAMFAPVVMRFMTYAPPLAGDTRAYCDAMANARGVAEWIADARQETEFVAQDEPYYVAS